MTSTETRRAIRIGNFSGVIGDRFEALSEMVRAEPPVDVAIGDYMAEITVSVASSRFHADTSAARGFSGEYFLRQVRPLLGEIADRGTKVVTNAGIMDPEGLARTLREDIAAAGANLRVAVVRGDDIHPRVAELVAAGQLTHLDDAREVAEAPESFFAANAYLGGWGIAAALRGGADIVITGRVADASLVLGPAAWWHGWAPEDLDRAAGAIAAAHIIECGSQATGGNFSGFAAIPDNTVLGFPIAEVEADGTSTITKRPQDGGAVTVDTVTAQLMYEIQGPLYRTPDVVLHVDRVELAQEGPDRVRVTGATGSPAPTTAKVGMHRLHGFRGATWVFPTGLEIEEKIAVLRAQAEEAATGLDVERISFEPFGRPVVDPRTQQEATTAVRVAVEGPTADGVRAFCARFPSFGLGSIPGYYVDFLLSMGSVQPQARVSYWPGLVDQRELRHEVVFEDGRTEPVPLPPMEDFGGQPAQTEPPAAEESAETVEAPLGAVAFTRVGDKGGNANLGIWTPREAAYPWLRSFLTASRLRDLLGLDATAPVERYEMPHLHGISFVLPGYFGDSGSENLAVDQIGKSLGEFLRARHVRIPRDLVPADVERLERGAGRRV